MDFITLIKVWSMRESRNERMVREKVKKTHLVTDVIACGVDLEQLRPQLLVNTAQDGDDSQWPHVRMLHQPHHYWQV